MTQTGLPDSVRRSHDFYQRWSPVFYAAYGPWLQAGLLEDAKLSGSPARSAMLLAQRAGVCADHRVLDAGCGMGGPAVAIAEGIRGVTIDGVTIAPIQVDMARRLISDHGLTDRVRVHLADYHHLPFADATFDTALFFESTSYSDNPAGLFAEVYRVLRPGGTVYIKDVFRIDGELTTPQLADLAAFDQMWAGTTPTMSSTVHALRQAGFRDVVGAELPGVSSDRLLASMFELSDEGFVLSAVGRQFFRRLPNLPTFFGEASASKPATGPGAT